MTHQSHSFGPGARKAPKIVKWTMLATLILSFFTIVSHALFTQVLHLPSPQFLLSLSLWGVEKFFLWQFISYLFVQPLSAEGFSFPLILHIFFDLYLLWAIGSAIVEAKGKKHFVGLYFGGALFIGLIAALLLFLFHSPLPFSGATMSIYILMIGWVFLYPEAMIMVFMMIPMRAKWLVFGLIGVNLLLDFSNGAFLSFALTAGALTFGYLYAILCWDILSPFHRLHPIEKRLIYTKRTLLQSFRRKRSPSDSPKVYDIRTGKAIVQDGTID